VIIDASRTVRVMFLNEEDKPENFSIINSLPHFKTTEEMLGFRFIEEKYPHQFNFLFSILLNALSEKLEIR